MKKIICITVFTFATLFSCQKGEHIHEEVESQENHTYYTCSMHPQVRKKSPGKCPICSMGLTKIKSDPVLVSSKKKKEKKVKEVFYCEIDPTVTSLVPGTCPIDGKQMIKKRQEVSTIAQLKLRALQIDHFRASTFKVRNKLMSKEIRLLGSLMKSEQKQSNIPARISGRVEDVYIRSTGSFIKKGDPVVKFYSPQLLGGAEEYLIAYKNFIKNKKNIEFKDLFLQSRERLKLWGVQDEQLKKWAKEKRIPRVITLYSPVTGIVEKKNAVQGKYFKEGASFFDLVDLSSLWVELDVYEHDSAYIKLGQKVEIEFQAYPGQSWKGEIDFVSPILDKKTRTLKIRTTLDNSEGKLRPGMVGTAQLNVEFSNTRLVIPKSAMIDTGKKKVAWIKKSKGLYEARLIRTGIQAEGHIEVLEGLEKGDEVVTQGNFMLDAQAQLFGSQVENFGDDNAD